MEAIGAGLASIFSSIGAAAGTTAGQAVIAGTASSVVGAGLSAALAPDAPQPKGPTPMPDQSAIDQAKKRSLLLQRQRGGRESTILSQGDGGTLG